MTITNLFNETELTIFFRQTNFTFGEFYRSSDGSICAIDHQSGQIFIGNDLLRSNVHKLDSIAGAENRNGGGIHLTFNDLSSVEIEIDEESAKAIIAEIEDNETKLPAENKGTVSEEQDCQEQESQEPFCQEPASFALSNEELNEFYTRLVNRGRDSAISYLIREIGMSFDEAAKYVAETEGQETMPESGNDTDYERDGSMTKRAMLDTLKKLKTGDRIHINYDPWIGKPRIYEGEFLRMEVSASDRYFSLEASGYDFNSLVDNVVEQLYDNIYVFLYCDGNASEISCSLKRIIVLMIMDKPQ